MKKITWFIILFVMLMGASDANALDIRIDGDKLSLHANNVPLQDILHSMAKMGIRIQIDPQINPTISADFENRDIQKGLASVLKSINHVLIWDAVEGSTGRSFKLTEVQIFEPGKKGLMQPLRKRSALSIVRNPKDGSLFVKDEILLKLKPGTSASILNKLLKKIGGVVIESNQRLGIYKIRLPENSDVPTILDAIAKYTGIKKAEPNYAYPISTPYRTTGSAQFSSGKFSSLSLPEGTVPIAVLDTGLDPEIGLGDLVLASLDALNPGDEISDTRGHGTQMALIAAGVIQPYGASSEDEESYTPVIPIKSLDDNGYTSNFNVMESIDFALANGARVMSLSWGSETKSEFLEDAMNYASSEGLIIVASAGNEPTGNPVYPAAYSSVIGVGALGPDGKRWEKSNYGDFVNLYAPGFASMPVGYEGDAGLYAGTSISAAFVANQIATYLSQHPNATNQDALNAITNQ